ncbi:MAG TPA: GxxExxY protein [Hanamia sp.]|nr:GxxExxY protein [Hanamia sp.]
MTELLYKEESFKIIGICMEIHKALGMGLKEINYKDALEMEFIENKIQFEREKRFVVKYKGKTLRNPYAADFVVYNSIILEIKSTSALIPVHFAQALSYLSVSNKKLALVINFGEKSLVWKRIVK